MISVIYNTPVFQCKVTWYIRLLFINLRSDIHLGKIEIVLFLIIVYNNNKLHALLSWIFILKVSCFCPYRILWKLKIFLPRHIYTNSKKKKHHFNYDWMFALKMRNKFHYCEQFVKYFSIRWNIICSLKMTLQIQTQEIF